MVDIRSFIRQLLPQHCLLCGADHDGDALCPSCRCDLPWPAAACPRCALAQPGGTLCGRCLRHPPQFDVTLAVLDFAFPLDALLRRYKYRGLLAIAALGGELLAERAAALPLPDLLLPMPLHAERLQQRGFNQALEIARVAGRRLAIPLDVHGCRRIRATPPQAGLSHRQRVRNLRGAFVCDSDLNGKRVALIDDVMTTGASLDALAGAVKKAGAAHVACWVVARTQRQPG